MTAHTHFIPFSSLHEISRGNGIVNYVIASKKIGAQAMHTGISKLPPGTRAPRHSHNAEEQVTVLEGTVEITLGDRTQVCRRYDSTFIAPHVEHEIVNVGADTATVLVIYGAPEVSRTFAGSGETVSIGSDGDRFSG